MRVSAFVIGAAGVVLAGGDCGEVSHPLYGEKLVPDGLGDITIINGPITFRDACSLPQERVVDNFAVADLGSEHSLVATGAGTHVFEVFDKAYGRAIAGSATDSAPPDGGKASDYCGALTKPALGCSAEDWVGKMRDVFSPDDTCPESTRYVSLVGGKLHVSASHTDDGCTSTWGIKYDPTTTVDPIITLDEADACTGKVSFRSKVGPDAPIYADAQVPPRPTPADAPRRRLPTPHAAACQRPTPLPRVPCAPTHSHDATDCIRTLPATERVHACVARRGARSTSR